MLPLFNPGLEIQNTENYVDWSSLSVVHLTDVMYTSRTIPSGAEDTIDVATLTFEMPIWISLPAKVKKMGVVAEIIASIYNANGELSEDAITSLSGLISQQRFTPLSADVVYVGNSLRLYKNARPVGSDEVVGETMRWRDLINLYT